VGSHLHVVIDILHVFLNRQEASVHRFVRQILEIIRSGHFVLVENQRCKRGKKKIIFYAFGVRREL
jgi:hypothetical protein